MGIQMNRLPELATISTDQRRVELAKLLAAGVIRLLIDRYRNPPVAVGNSEESLAVGLEES